MLLSEHLLLSNLWDDRRASNASDESRRGSNNDSDGSRRGSHFDLEVGRRGSRWGAPLEGVRRGSRLEMSDEDGAAAKMDRSSIKVAALFF